MRDISPEVLAQLAESVTGTFHLFEVEFDDETVRNTDAYIDIRVGPATAGLLEEDVAGNDGTAVGDLHSGEGYFGTGILVLGWTGSLEFPPVVVTPLTSMTVECFMRSSQQPDATSPMLVYFNAAASGTGFGPDEFHIGFSSDGAARLGVGANICGTTIDVTGATINDNRWHHVAMVLDDAAGKASLWVDGVESASDTFTPGALDLSGVQQCRVGRPATGTTRAYSGLFDNLAIWDSAITPTVPTGNYPYNPPAAGLAGYWRFGGGPRFVANGHQVGFIGLDETTDLSQMNITASLSGVDQQWISLVLSKRYIDRPIRIYRGFIDKNFDVVPYPYILFEGTMNAPRIRDNVNDANSDVSVIATNEWAKWQTPNGRRTNDEEQNLIYGTDKAFEYTTQISGPIKWGGQERSDDSPGHGFPGPPPPEPPRPPEHNFPGLPGSGPGGPDGFRAPALGPAPGAAAPAWTPHPGPFPGVDRSNRRDRGR